MGAAVLVMAVAWRIRQRMGTPAFAERFSLPDRNDLDVRLISGSILFGIGWGIAGLCPGPAVASLAISPLSLLRSEAPRVGSECVRTLRSRLSPALYKKTKPKNNK